VRVFFGLIEQSYYQQIAVDTQILTSSFASLMSGDYTAGHIPFYAQELFGPSYSLDRTNFYAFESPETNLVSGYFQKVRNGFL
jgi:hypothetical protein